MSRKWKITLGVLAVVVVFYLWYTRPRSFEELVGDVEFQNFSMVAITMDNKGGKMVSDSWQLDSYEGREDTVRVLKDILQSCQYRVSLRSLLPFSDNFSGSVDIGTPMIQLIAGLEDESSFFAFYRGETVMLSTDKTIIAKAVDKDIGDKLLAYTQEFGWET